MHELQRNMLALQRSVGNRQVCQMLDQPKPASGRLQRTITILNYDIDKPAPLDVEAVRTAIRAKVASGPPQTQVLANLNAANTGNWQGVDITTLATDLCQGVAKADVAAVAAAIGGTLTIANAPKMTNRNAETIHGTNRDEASQFDLVTEKAAQSMSRTKGTPNQVDITILDRVPKTSNIATIIQGIRDLDNQLRGKPTTMKDYSVGAWATELGFNINVRQAHGNFAGWLPAVEVQTQFDIDQQQLDARIALPHIQAWINAPGQDRTENEARYNFITNDNLFPAARRRHYIWAAHAGAVSPYIEFSVPGKKDQRVVYDFVNEQFYFTVHYKWYKGYNPFFLILGA